MKKVFSVFLGGNGFEGLFRCGQLKRGIWSEQLHPQVGDFAHPLQEHEVGH